MLNEHPAYEDFRKAREQFHVRNLDPDPLVLIQNIDKFSTTADYDQRVKDGKLISIDNVTDAYMFLYNQSKDAWTFELDLRTSQENW